MLQDVTEVTHHELAFALQSRHTSLVLCYVNYKIPQLLDRLVLLNGTGKKDLLRFLPQYYTRLRSALPYISHLLNQQWRFGIPSLTNRRDENLYGVSFASNRLLFVPCELL